MQLIHFTDERLGSLDWELPLSLSEKMASLPEQDQKLIREEVENQLRAFLHTLNGALSSGNAAELSLKIIRAVGTMQSTILLELLKAVDAQ